MNSNHTSDRYPSKKCRISRGSGWKLDVSVSPSVSSHQSGSSACRRRPMINDTLKSSCGSTAETAGRRCGVKLPPWRTRMEGEKKKKVEREVWDERRELLCIVVTGNRCWPVSKHRRESQRARASLAESRRLGLLGNPSKTGPVGSGAPAGQSGLPTILYLIFLLLVSLSLSLFFLPSPSDHLVPSNTRPRLFSACKSVVDKAEKDSNTPHRLSKIDISCNYSHDAPGISPQFPSSSRHRVFLFVAYSRRFYSSRLEERGGFFLLSCKAIFLRNGKTFRERNDICSLRGFKIPTVWRMWLQLTLPFTPPCCWHDIFFAHPQPL